jgi:hypothetical protein
VPGAGRNAGTTTPCTWSADRTRRTHGGRPGTTAAGTQAPNPHGTRARADRPGLALLPNGRGRVVAKQADVDRATHPEDLSRLIVERLNAGDVDGLVAAANDWSPQDQLSPGRPHPDRTGRPSRATRRHPRRRRDGATPTGQPVDSNDLCLLIKQVDYDAAEQPVSYSVEYHRASALTFQLVRHGPYRVEAAGDEAPAVPEERSRAHRTAVPGKRTQGVLGEVYGALRTTR